jgi:hypothetical protein
LTQTTPRQGSYRVTEGLAADVRRTDHDRFSWQLKEYRALEGKLVGFKRWSEPELNVEFVSFQHLTPDDRALVESLSRMARSPKLTAAAVAKGQFDASMVEFGAWRMQLHDGSFWQTKITSGDFTHITWPRLTRGVERVKRQGQFELAQVAEARFFHIHPDNDPILSSADLNVVQLLRKEWSQQGMRAPIRIFASSRVQGEFVTTHLGLQPAPV